MVRHIVMLRLENPQKIAPEVKQRLEALVQEIEQIKELKVGLNFNSSDRKSDLVLETTFETENALDIYQQHPKHQEVVQFINLHKIESRVVDYHDV